MIVVLSIAGNKSGRFGLLFAVAVLLAVVLAGVVGVLGPGSVLLRRSGFLLLHKDEAVINQLLLLVGTELTGLLLAG